MLLYIASCDAGSMFDGILREDTNILAITASGPRENAYACYCGFDLSPSYYTCLGSLFSVKWMEDLDESALSKSSKQLSIFNDYREVRTNVTKSNIMMYGDFEIGSEKLSSFIGYHENSDEVSRRDLHEREIQYQLAHGKLSVPEFLKLSTELRQNNKGYESGETLQNKIENPDEISHRLCVQKHLLGGGKGEAGHQECIGDYGEPNYLKLNLSVFPCYRSILNQITESCFSLPKNPYVLDKIKIFANMCVVDNQIHQMICNIIIKSCSDVLDNIINVQ
ncbi:legumain-like [Aphis craccivora]|uniref:Legumain-like n=1 Tax=Aphis craccivora TaxID=307492 RepID=A0A6G0W9U7_APHCR|nr:legumain-like [Aphis craccivora]